jgi:hypothetical protein
MGSLTNAAVFNKIDRGGLDAGDPYRGKDIERRPSRERRGERIVDDKVVLGLLIDNALKAETLDNAGWRYLGNALSVAVNQRWQCQALSDQYALVIKHGIVSNSRYTDHAVVVQWCSWPMMTGHSTALGATSTDSQHVN